MNLVVVHVFFSNQAENVFGFLQGLLVEAMFFFVERDEIVGDDPVEEAD